MKQNSCIRPLALLFLFFLSQAGLSQNTNYETSENLQASWIQAVNNVQNLENFYSEYSGIMLEDEIYTGTAKINSEIADLISKFGKITDYKVLEIHQLRENQKFIRGEYETANGTTLSTIIGWKHKGNWTKEFEVIYNRSTCSSNDTKSMDSGRENWQRNSNFHRPDLIVEQVFSKNGMYFNQGILSKGNEIADAYAYMNDESYKIQLEGLDVFQVNCEVIFEIGTFEVGGKGLYVFVWKRESDTWKLLVDFNF